MSEHFFYVSRAKHAKAYRTLLLANIVCAVGIVWLCGAYSNKDFARHKIAVMKSMLGDTKLSNMNELETMADFHEFLNKVIKVI